jgi:hypothetical protein
MNRGNARRSLCYKTVEESLPSKLKGSSHFCHENDDFYVASSSETGPRAQISQQVWCVTPKGPPLAIAVQCLEPADGTRFGVLPELGPALASVEFISAKRTTESYQKTSLTGTRLRVPVFVVDEATSPCLRSGRGYESLSS